MRISFAKVFILSAALISCDSVDTGKTPSGAAPDSFQAQLTGNWKGHMTNKTVDVGSSLRGQEATAEFNFTSETEGSFIIDLPNLTNAKVDGTFTDFAGKSLHLAIKSSTVSVIGASGSSTSLSYNMIGSNFELYNDRVDLQLIRQTDSQQQNQNPNQQQQDEDGMAGRWKCFDKLSNIWYINVRDKTQFSGDIDHASGGSAWISGTITVDPKDDVTGAAKITGSRQKSYVGMRLTFKLFDASLLEVTRFSSKDDADSSVEDQFQCGRNK